MINIMTPDAAINDNAPAAYRGLDRGVARARIVADLDALGLIERIEPHKLMVPRGDRTNSVLEPLLTDQWFVDIKPLAAPAIRAVEDGRIRFVPENWAGVYYEWMRNIKDWCISRQLWWGHRIPAWYDDEGRWYVARSEAEARAAHGLDAAVRPAPGRGRARHLVLVGAVAVLDPGMAGADSRAQHLLPDFGAGHGIRHHLLLGRPHDHDGPQVHRRGAVPRRLRARPDPRSRRQKMSKSKGNVIDPLDIVDGITLDELLAKRTSGLMQPQMKPAIEKATRKQFPQGIPAFGTDALRLTFAALATQSRDLRFDMAKVEGNRNFCNKLWNAARYVLMNVEGRDSETAPGQPAAASNSALPIAGSARGSTPCCGGSHPASPTIGFDTAANALYEFTWSEFCDWYLELSKAVLQSDGASAAQKRGTRSTLIGTLEALLRALHPARAVHQRGDLAAGAHCRRRRRRVDHARPFPAAGDIETDPAAEPEMRWVMNFILGVRQIRGEMDIAPSRRLEVLLQNAGPADLEYLARNHAYLTRLAGIIATARARAGRGCAHCGGRARRQTRNIGADGGSDRSASRDRTLEQTPTPRRRPSSTSCSPSSANGDFAKNAPAEVVAKDRLRLAELRAETDQLAAQIARVSALRTA